VSHWRRVARGRGAYAVPTGCLAARSPALHAGRRGSLA
jgi:hypothetical protein